VVDDDEDALELIARILESATYTVERCGDHATALTELRNADPPFSGLVIDFQSGGTSSSLKLLDAVRHIDEPSRSSVPTLILTSADTNRVFAWQSGTDGFLVRPFHADEMVEQVHAMLERTADEREQHRRDQMKQARTAQSRRMAE
jgi:DNA-binding response OmpR family regulator